MTVLTIGRLWKLAAGLTLAGSVACSGSIGGAGVDPPREPRDAGWESSHDAGPGSPPVTFTAVARELLTRRVDIDALHVLVDGSLVTLDRDGLLEVSPDGSVETRASQPEIGALQHAMRTPEGLLVASARGWVSLSNGALEEPALERTLPAASVEWLAATSPTSAWLSRAEGLALWADGVVRPFTSDFAFEGRSMRGVRVNRGGTLWDVVWLRTADDRVLRVEWDGSRALAEASPNDGFADLALTTSARAFAVHRDGTVWWGDSPSTLEPLRFAGDVVSTHAAGTAVWLRGRDGTLTFVEGDGAVFTDDGGARSGRAFGLNDGSLALLRGPRLERVTARWDARFDGVLDGDEILAPRRVRIVLADGAPAPVAIVASVAGLGLASDLLARTFDVPDPSVLVAGPADLSVEVRFDDGTLPVTLEAQVVIPGAPPTWADTIEPLYRDRCSDCHDVSAGARNLDSREAWIRNRDEILYDVREMRMPKPPRAPLSALETARIEAWFAAGSP